MKVGKSIVFECKMGMRKFWSVALPFGKVACAVKVHRVALIIFSFLYRSLLNLRFRIRYRIVIKFRLRFFKYFFIVEY